MRMMIFAAAIVHASLASAQPAPDWRATLVELYAAEIAFDFCKTLTPSGHDLLRLEAAIVHVEVRTELPDKDLDAIFQSVEFDSVSEPGFCRRMADASARVQAIPEDYQ